MPLRSLKVMVSAAIRDLIGFGKAGFCSRRAGGELHELVIDGTGRIKAGAGGINGMA